MRKTEYVVRASYAPTALASLRTRFEGRRRRQVLGPSWLGRAREWSARIEALPWRELHALPWRAIGAGIVGGVLLLLVTSALVFQVAYGERVQPGVHAVGLDLGGKTLPEAQDLVTARIRVLSHEPLTLYFDNREWQTTAADLGMTLEPEPIVSAAYGVGRDGNPFDLLTRPIRSLVAAWDVPQPEVALDVPRVDAYLGTVAAAVDRPMASAKVALDASGRVEYAPAETERRVDLAASRERLRGARFVGDTVRVPVVVAERDPPITDADLAGAREAAERYLAAPVVLELNGDSWRLDAAEIAGIIERVGPAERPTDFQIKDAALEQAVRRIVSGINQPASNARFEFIGAELRPIRESHEGRQVDFAATLAAVRQALGSSDRTVQVPATISEPAVTTAQRAGLGIHELIERGETRFAGSSPPKIHNIKLAASRLHGVVVPPGALFSFNQELGPTTLDSGYQVGWGIAASGDGGHATVPSVAGGICQVATTLFQPVFWGGYQVEERHNHLYWIYAYGQPPLGRTGLDATVDEDFGLDFRFVNSSPDYLLIQTATDESSVTISLYGTKPRWSVKVDGPTISNWKTASQEIVRSPEPSLPWGQRMQVESAGDGFDVGITRTVSEAGSVRTLNLKTHYEPSQNMVVVGVRGAPAGAAEEIRASNRQRPNTAVGAAAGGGTPASSTAVLPAQAPTLAPTVGPASSSGATSAPVSPSAAPSPVVVPAPVAPTASGAGALPTGPSGGSTGGATTPASGSSARVPSAPSTAASAPAVAPAAGAAAPAAAPVTAPNAPRFGSSPSR